MQSKKIPVNAGEKNILCLGAESCNSITHYSNKKALHWKIGDLLDPEKLKQFKRIAAEITEKEKVDEIRCDLHPNYLSTLFAEKISEEKSIPLKKIQHHKVHAYSVALEKNLTDFAGIVCDGAGYGEDGKIWGGEVFSNQKRIGSLEEQLMPGNDLAVKKPARMLIPILQKFLNEKEIKKIAADFFSEKEFQTLEQQIRTEFNSTLTTSAGRILDCVSAFLGICKERTLEKNPAIELEKHSAKPFDLEPKIESRERKILNTTCLFEFLCEHKNEKKERLAATAQIYLAEGLYRIAEQENKPIVFSGGVGYNRIIRTHLTQKAVMYNSIVGPGDFGISFGQLGNFKY